MTFGELTHAIELGKYDPYSDRVDVSIEISLLEYGLIRNPKTNEVIYYDKYGDCDFFEMDLTNVELKHTTISLEEVIDYLKEVGPGFFSYIGSERQKELDRLDNDNLTHIVQSATSYDGFFNLN